MAVVTEVAVSSPLCARYSNVLTSSPAPGDLVIQIIPQSGEAVQGRGPSTAGSMASVKESEMQQETPINSPGGDESEDAVVAEPRPWFTKIWILVFRYLRKPLEAYCIYRRSRDPGSDGRYDGFRFEKLKDYPAGYPQLATFISSDENFQVYRRFKTLRNRVILHRQQELVRLEKRLKELDKADSVEHPERLTSIRKDKEASDSTRPALIDEIDEKLRQYDDLLERERRSISMEQPTQRNHRALVNWYWNEKPVVFSEVDYVNQQDDFVILTREQDSPFHVFLENRIQRFPFKWLQRYFATQAQRQRTDDPFITLFSKQRLNYLVGAIVIFVSVVLLMVPIVLLFNIQTNDKIKVVIVLVFILVFPPAIACFARPKNHEVFTATAAYCAVLVVFLANFSTTSATTSSNP